MNCRLSKCGSLVVDTSLRRCGRSPRPRRYMSIENSDFSDRNTTRLPSGLIAGVTLRSPPPCSREISERPNDVAGRAVSYTAANAFFVASCHSVVSCLSSTPSTAANRRLEVAVRCGGAQQIADRAIAPSPGDVGPERVAVAIRKEVGIVELVDRRHRVARRRFTHPHRGVANRSGRATGTRPCLR